MKKIIYFLLIGFVLSGCNSENDLVFDDPENETGMLNGEIQYSITKYEYTVDLPSIYTTEERRDACQIPIATLQKMTTQAVIEAILNHPMLMNIYAYNFFIDGFNSVFRENNALAELSKRDDASTLLLERLIAAPTEISAVFLPLNRAVLEYMSSQYLDNTDDMKRFVETVSKNYELRKNNHEAYDMVSLVLIGQTMLAAKYTPFVNAVNENRDLQSFVTLQSHLTVDASSIAYNPIYIEIIIDFAINFINKK